MLCQVLPLLSPSQPCSGQWSRMPLEECFLLLHWVQGRSKEKSGSPFRDVQNQASALSGLIPPTHARAAGACTVAGHGSDGRAAPHQTGLTCGTASSRVPAGEGVLACMILVACWGVLPLHDREGTAPALAQLNTILHCPFTLCTSREQHEVKVP